jgi:hypothetical protein
MPTNLGLTSEMRLVSKSTLFTRGLLTLLALLTYLHTRVRQACVGESRACGRCARDMRAGVYAWARARNTCFHAGGPSEVPQVPQVSEAPLVPRSRGGR